jgi:hypothetical protein
MPPHLRWDSTRLLRVSAQTEGTISLDVRWPLPFDALLGSAAMSRRRRPITPRSPTPALPLTATTTFPSSQWWWVASGAIPLTDDPRWAMRRGPGALQALGTRARQAPVEIRCHIIEWWCAGDGDRILDLVRDVTHLGDRAHRVRGWAVADEGPSALAPVVWDDEDYITRPVPLRHAELVGAPIAPDVVDGAVRPPYWRPPIGDGANREWRPVLAPWTIRVGACWEPHHD